MDSFGRVIDYLRISITDQCDERCSYCKPENHPGWEDPSSHLTADEIVRVAGVAAGLGFRKFRLTGGEPLLRPEVVEIIRAMAAIPGMACIGLSTNGTRLEPMAGRLRAAGLRMINVSLDALNPDVYRRVTGGDVTKVVAGVRAAMTAGFERVKLNCVLMRGVNEAEIWPLVVFAAEHGLPLRLIELMPLTKTDVLNESSFLPASEVMGWLRERDELVPQPDARLGWGPAKYYRLKQTGALVGFIGAITSLRFCETCNKIRLTADGNLRACLADHHAINLRGALRSNQGEAMLQAHLQTVLRQKPWEHRFCGQYTPGRPMIAIGG
ncbi:MAG: GTP 3',8-cyclase MoaA [Verrucomicrobia bacterium]|nr:GTP 3',8-cyclase MoaA [Verrucomicrobiota bacterium]